MTRFISFLLLLLICNSVSSQNLAFNESPSSIIHTDSSTVFVKTECKNRSILKSAILPISLVATGALIEILPSNSSIGKEGIQKHFQTNVRGFNTTADNYLQFVPLVALYGFKLAGLKSKNNFLNQAILTAKSELLVSAIVFSMKRVIKDNRPDGSDDNSMPSGHTAQAFASATLLDMEYRDTSPWISVSGYLCAAATGFLRIANNHHWASDVLIGAGIGIASVKIVYLTHRHRWGKNSTSVLVPTIYSNGGGMAFSMKF